MSPSEEYISNIWQGIRKMRRFEKRLSGDDEDVWAYMSGFSYAIYMDSGKVKHAVSPSETQLATWDEEAANGFIDATQDRKT